MSAVSIPNGDYYINVRSKVASSVDIPGASGTDSTAIQLYSGNGPKLSSLLSLNSLMAAM